MEAARAELVDLIRDFLVAHQRMSALFDRFRERELRFEDVEELVGDGPESVLYRLKERSHLLFRSDDPEQAIGAPRRALFDLAVGSLFHEAMKFRENLYQTEIYAPKVRRLQQAAGEESGDLFRDFEKILTAAAGRLEESLVESELLLEHTRAQFRLLLTDAREDPILARTLYVSRALVEAVFPEGLDALLGQIYDEPMLGYLAAARSFLESAYFDEAIDALSEAEKRSEDCEDVAQLAAYAEGMQAFMAGNYEACLARLEDWLDAEPGAAAARQASLARTAISRLDALTADDDPESRRSLTETARALLARLEVLAPQRR